MKLFWEVFGQKEIMSVYENRRKIQLEANTAYKDYLELVEIKEYCDTKKVYRMVKRVVDVFIASLLLFLLFPLLMIISICIKLESPREKVFFLQKRIGYLGIPFYIYKFRSMKSEAPHNVATSNFENPEKYISVIGKVIRRSSLDELPQLWNVVRGDMSIVGPRPLICAEVEVHELRKRYDVYRVLPGITGLAQVNGRDMVDIYEKVYYDFMYVQNYSFLQDVGILLSTVNTIICHKGYQEGKGSCE